MTRNSKFFRKIARPLSIALLTVPLLLAAQLSAANAVTDWNTIASTTIVKNGGKGPGTSGVWFAYSSLAAYDAVNAITGQYHPFYYTVPGPPDASLEAAVAAAAHRVLVNYFPSQQSALDAQLATSLARIANASARDKGVAVGESAATAVILARAGDGLEANITYVPGSGPGAWIPTPPAFAPPATPWFGQLRPFVMKTAGDFLPDKPPALTSEIYKRDYNLTRLYGGAASDLRSASEAEIGVFYTENTGQQYARAFNYLVDTYQLNTADSARMMAMFWTGFADAGVACYNAKYTYGFWRPVTAIAAGGGNPDLVADPSWLPLAVTPAHPEYPAAHGCLTGATTALIADYFGTTKVHIVVDSTAFTDSVHQHVFEDTRDMMDEVFWARIYAGLHFHHSLEVARDMGTSVASVVSQQHFRARHAAGK